MDKPEAGVAEFICVEIDLEEDVIAELEDLILYSRLGLILEATEIVYEALWPHLYFFPIVAEIAIFSVEHHDLGMIRRLLAELQDRDLTFNNPDEQAFVKLLRQLVSDVSGEERSVNPPTSFRSRNSGRRLDTRTPTQVQMAQIHFTNMYFGSTDYQVWKSFVKPEIDLLLKETNAWQASQMFSLACDCAIVHCSSNAPFIAETSTLKFLQWLEKTHDLIMLSIDVELKKFNDGSITLDNAAGTLLCYLATKMQVAKLTISFGIGYEGDKRQISSVTTPKSLDGIVHEDIRLYQFRQEPRLSQLYRDIKAVFESLLQLLHDKRPRGSYHDFLKYLSTYMALSDFGKSDFERERRRSAAPTGFRQSLINAWVRDQPLPSTHPPRGLPKFAQPRYRINSAVADVRPNVEVKTNQRENGYEEIQDELYHNTNAASVSYPGTATSSTSRGRHGSQTDSQSQNIRPPAPVNPNKENPRYIPTVTRPTVGALPDETAESVIVESSGYGHASRNLRTPSILRSNQKEAPERVVTISQPPSTSQLQPRIASSKPSRVPAEPATTQLTVRPRANQHSSQNTTADPQRTARQEANHVDENEDASDEDDDDPDYPFTNLSSKICQLFIKIPLHDFKQRVSFLDCNRELLKRSTLEKIEPEFLKQSIDFSRMGKHMATVSCIVSHALLRMGKDQTQLTTLFRNLLNTDSAEKKTFGEIVKGLNTLVEQKAVERGPLALPVRKDSGRKPTRSVATTMNISDLFRGIQAMDPGSYMRTEDDLDKNFVPNPKYKVRTNDAKNFFIPGKLFAILWTEKTSKQMVAEDLMELGKNKSSSLVQYGETVHTHIRRMVVVRSRKGSSWCVSIDTYGGKGLLKPGLTPEDIAAHTVIHDAKNHPIYLPDEPKSPKRPIKVAMVSGEALEDASRIHLGKPYNVGWNVKVMNVGQIVKQDLDVFLAYVRQVMGAV